MDVPLDLRRRLISPEAALFKNLDDAHRLRIHALPCPGIFLWDADHPGIATQKDMGMLGIERLPQPVFELAAGDQVLEIDLRPSVLWLSRCQCDVGVQRITA